MKGEPPHHQLGTLKSQNRLQFQVLCPDILSLIGEFL